MISSAVILKLYVTMIEVQNEFKNSEKKINVTQKCGAQRLVNIEIFKENR